MSRPFPSSASAQLKARHGQTVYWCAWVGAGRPGVVLRREEAIPGAVPGDAEHCGARGAAAVPDVLRPPRSGGLA